MIENELQAALTGWDLEQSLQATTPPELQASSMVAGNLKPGQTITGKILAIHGRDVFVDLPGQRYQGVIPLDQFAGRAPVVGEEVHCRLERYDAENGLWQLALQGAAQVVTNWSQLQPQMIVEARVVGVNKQRSGLLVEVAGVRGFLPASQIDLQRVEDLDAWVQQRLKVKILEVNPAERNLVVSRRAVLEAERQQKAEEFWAQVEEGQVLRGVVRHVRPFGAFVDLGGADGLLPASELAWQHVDKIEDVVQPGQPVEVMVTKIDRSQRKLTLSLKRLSADPWEQWAAQTRPGATISGVVTRLAEFGAFVQVAPGIEGLVHITELAPHRVRRVSEVVQPGQQVSVEVLSVDPQQRRLSLSMRTLIQRHQEAEAAARIEEQQHDIQEAIERLAQRKPSRPGLRGGIGSDPLPPLG
jgi:small subunit ribosomal protein S1